MSRITKMSRNKSKQRVGKSNPPAGKSKPPRKAAPPRNKSSKTKNGIGNTLVRQICGLTDPFCTHAYGAKYPDDSSAKTLPSRINWLTTMFCNSVGNSSRLFLPHVGMYAGQDAVPNLASYPSLSFSVIEAPKVADMTGATGYRIVSAGLKIKRISAPLDSSGMVHIRSYSQEDGATFSHLTANDLQVSNHMDVPLQDCKELTVLFPHTSQMPQVFYPVTDIAVNVVDWKAAGFGAILVSISGGPADATALQVELIMHIEYVFSDNAPLALVTTPSPPANPVVTSIAAKVTSSAEYFVHKSLDATSAWIYDVASRSVANWLRGSAVSNMALLTL